MAIDTSCDDTSVAILKKDWVIANVISSQIELHRKWGGVVPDIARRAHQDKIDGVIKESLSRASKVLKKKVALTDLDAIAVTYGPGLAIALEIGVSKAKEIAKQYQIPFIAVNHMEGHLLSALAKNSLGKKGLSLQKKDFPLLGVLISGGHTDLVLMHDFGKYELVGQKLDDAIGEAYDKAARMLGLGYPGGPVLTEFAKHGDKNKYPLTIPMLRNKTLNFSYSGLKTAVYYLLERLTDKHRKKISKQQTFDIAASFEASAIRHLQDRLKMAIEKYHPHLILVGGGVGSSPKVRAGIRQIAKNFELKAHFPFDKRLFMDNGAMIGVAAFYRYLRGKFSPLNTDRHPRASIADES